MEAENNNNRDSAAAADAEVGVAGGAEQLQIDNEGNEGGGGSREEPLVEPVFYHQQALVGNLCSAFFCLMLCVKIVFFGAFALDNPDREAWYGIDLVSGEPKLYESDSGAS